jgi:uncharacterized SAM-binding protein YcdF (DUF218 family)
MDRENSSSSGRAGFREKCAKITGGVSMDFVGFVLKKLVSAMVQPVGISFVLVVTGLIIWKLKHWSRAGAFLIVAGSAFLLVLSLPITSYLLLYSLEAQAGSYQDPDFLKSNGVQYIVVLGGVGSTDELTPADKSGDSIYRVLEGVRLWHGVPGSRLVLSGMAHPVSGNNLESMKSFPMYLGVESDALTIYANAWDTEDEAEFVSAFLGDSTFALVSSAYHIPRAMKQFRNKGLNAVASPCGFKAKTPPQLYRSFLPEGSALLGSELAIHEYLGQLWMNLKNLVSRTA